MAENTVVTSWLGQEVLEATAAAVTRGLGLAAEHVKSVAIPLTPLLTGALRESADTDVDADELTASVFYDDPEAVPQHENLHFSHRIGQAKFLEVAAETSRDEVSEIIAAQLRALLT